MTEDFLRRVILYYRGVIRKIGANKSSVTPHSGATAPLQKEPFAQLYVPATHWGKAVTLLSLARQPLIRPIRKRIAHLLREGEGFHGAKRLCLTLGYLSTRFAALHLVEMTLGGNVNV